MQHLESAAPPIAHPSFARWTRVPAAVALCLAHWCVVLILASVTGAAAGVLLAVRRGQAQHYPSPADCA
jgi:hypothetical protein